MRRTAPTLICAIAAVLAAAVPANADEDRRIRVFKVTAEGSGNFGYRYHDEPAPGFSHEIKRDVSYAWKVQLPSVAFLANGEGIAVSYDGQDPAKGNVTGGATEETTIVGSDGRGGKVTTHGYCEAKDQVMPASAPTIKPDTPTYEPGAEGSNITVTPFTHVAFPANCTAAIYGGQAQLSADPVAGGFDQHFYLPREATRQGKIIQLVHESPEQRDRCATTVSIGTCTFRWNGTLTFEFTGYLGEGELTEDDLPELPPGGGVDPQQPGPEPGPQPGPEPIEDEDLVLPLGGKLSRRGDSASVNVTCATACSGTVSAYPARGARAAGAKPIARRKFKAPAGKPVTVKLRFRGAALRKVRKAGAVRLVVATGRSKKTIVVRTRTRR